MSLGALPRADVEPVFLPPVQADAVVPDFTTLYQQQFGYVWHVLRRLGIPSRHLPDVTQDAFVTVYHRLETFDPTRPVRPWLFGIAYRTAVGHLRLGRNRREVPGTDTLDPTDEAPSAEQTLADQQNRQLVADALATLDLDRRAVLIAHDIDELPMSGIAEELGIPVKTLYSRLRVAREEFAASVRRIRLRRGER